jgi:hypothetical protein
MKLEAMAEEFIEETTIRMSRWQTIGANVQFIHATVKRLEENLEKKLGG